jgi:hypothetical protein
MTMMNLFRKRNPAMNEERRRILAMLSEGKLTAEQAERLLDALTADAPNAAPAVEPRYFRVEVDSREAGEQNKVNVRIPMQLLRAGVRLGSLLPQRARDKVNAALAKEGVDFDINTLKPDSLEAFIRELAEVRVDVGNEEARVRVYCE